MTEQSPITRRRMIAGTLGAGLATAAVFQIGRAQSAQDQSSTPGASPSTTTADTTGQGSDRAAERVATAITWATESITTAQGDRDAVGAEIDATTVDSMLTQATTLRDRAQLAGDGGDATSALRLAIAAGATAEAASDLVKAQLTYPGLPSQEAPSSRALANAHEAVQSVTDDVGTTTDEDVTFSMMTAQALYGAAYELYTSGSYAQAAATARVAIHLAGITWLLTASDENDRVVLRGDGLLDGFGDEDGPGPRLRGRGGRRARGPVGGLIRDAAADNDEPVVVPTPEF